ncbi:hypothetical protein [Ruegeria sp. HKCCA5929]|uniref:hypothetical protein n=1 Tax=Ruegeria sp. HKCCA5929 TaxID=2682988 RepID=UPI001489F9E8|nr:hypothetical protein [Ruegeria sp. HKCCA5929]
MIELKSKQETFEARLGSRVEYFRSAEWGGDLKVRKGQVAKLKMNDVEYTITMQDSECFGDHQLLTITREDGEKSETFADTRKLERGYTDLKMAMLALVQVFPWMAPKFIGEEVCS